MCWAGHGMCRTRSGSATNWAKQDLGQPWAWPVVVWADHALTRPLSGLGRPWSPAAIVWTGNGLVHPWFGTDMGMPGHSLV